MLSRLALVVVTLGFALKPTWSATIELTGRSVDGHTLGVKIEGEIEPGDAAKVLAIYKYFGPAATSNVFLWSRGGDADEAMKIGGIIRRLLLETWAPDRLHLFRMLGQFEVHAAPASKKKNI